MADRLNSSENLTVGSSITSEDGRFTLIMQGDGNLVLYGPGGRYRWDTGTGGRSVSQAIMQGDGNFVMYGPGGEYIWDTATNGHPGAWLIVQNDRNLVIYGADGSPLWATGTNSAILIVPPYLQLGNHGSALQSPEWCVVMWHTDNADVKWTVEFRQSPTSDWAQAVNVTGTKITVDKIPEHYVFRAELRNLLPGEEFEYRLLSGDEQVYPLEGVAKAHARKHCGPYRIAVMSDCGTDVAEEHEEQLEVANRIFEIGRAHV